MFKYYWFIIGIVLITIGFCIVFSEPVYKVMSDNILVPLGFIISGIICLILGYLFKDYREWKIMDTLSILNRRADLVIQKLTNLENIGDAALIHEIRCHKGRVKSYQKFCRDETKHPLNLPNQSLSYLVSTLEDEINSAEQFMLNLARSKFKWNVIE